MNFIPQNKVQQIYADKLGFGFPVGISENTSIQPIVLCTDEQTHTIFGPNDPSGTAYQKNFEYLDGILTVCLFSEEDHKINVVTYTVDSDEPVEATAQLIDDNMVYFNIEGYEGYYAETYVSLELSEGEHTIIVIVTAEDKTYVFESTFNVEEPVQTEEPTLSDEPVQTDEPTHTEEPTI